MASQLKNDNPPHTLTVEEARKGGINSGKARNYKKEQLDNLKMLLDSEYKDGITYRQAMNLGVLKGALDGKAENFKTILEYIDDSNSTSGTPLVQINVIDNSNLEKVMYQEGTNGMENNK